MLCLSGFELYSRWVPLTAENVKIFQLALCARENLELDLWASLYETQNAQVTCLKTAWENSRQYAMPPLVSLTKWQLMNKRRNWIQMSVTTRGSAFVWSCREGSLLQPSGKWSWHVISGNSCTCPSYEPRNVGCFLRVILRLELGIFWQILDVKCEKSVGYPLKTLSFLSFSENPRKGLALAPSLPPPFLAGKL